MDVFRGMRIIAETRDAPDSRGRCTYEVGGHQDLGTVLDEVLEGGDGGANARVIGDDAVLEGDVQVAAHEHDLALEIGPDSLKSFQAELAECKSVIWNGPMGVFEMEAFNKRTFGVCDTLASLDAITIIGGGDSVAAVEAAGLE